MILSPQSLLAAAEELALARSPAQFAEGLEHLARQVSGAREARFHPARGAFGRPASDEVGLRELGLAGLCLLHQEKVRDGETVCLPVRRYGATVGALQVTGAGEDLQGLEELARVAGLFWELVALREDVAACTARTEELLLHATEGVEPGAERHTLRVARLASELAAFMDLSAQSRQLVDRAARLHDVGKVALPGVSASERDRLHPGAGADYLRGTRVLADLAPLVEAHHERWDGSGFPQGLAGDEAPLEAWVLALAEDLDESRTLAGGAFESWLEGFLASRSRAHHPAVVDALGGLVVSGRLRELLD